ncbi:MAG: hypothetical protein V1720_20890 [bacterium]
MNKIYYSILVLLFFWGTNATVAQMDGLHGSDAESRMGVHSGNLFRTSFFNDGTYGGRVNRAPEVAGEWPINAGHYYLVDGNIFVGAEVTDLNGQIIHIQSENKCVDIGGSRGDKDPVTGEWWTFLPLQGFANPNDINNVDYRKIAMAKGAAEWANSWPAYWPDKFNDPSDPGWRNDNLDNNANKAAWNGYFGKNIFNADEESYFVADDYMNREFDFYPDSRDLTRKGLGLRVYVRGFQWAKAAVEDALFCLYDIENIGTSQYDKIVFGYKIGNNMGETVTGGDVGDDNAAFDRERNISYMWDNDDIGGGGYSPVGYMGGAFLESPGNAYDGIDNDNDGKNGSGPTINESLWAPRTLNANDPIIIINYITFERKVTTLAAELPAGKDTLEITYSSRKYKFWAGKVLEEIGDNLVDDNLNGLIDESRGAADAAGVFHYLYILNGTGFKYVDYFTGDGKDNPLLDERRDDGIDNDGDWSVLLDDTGADGIAPGARDYPGADFGERDGLPTNGEPHFDKTDIDETDMLGLTAFNLYEWSGLNQYDDEAYWAAMSPGLFSSSLTAQNVELLYGSGYFPLVPGQIERISMAILCGIDLEDIFRNKDNVALAYNQNYNFSKAPYIPTVRAVAGDGRVTLFWDKFAEESEDPISGKDFEGYRIYRSTDPGFNDMNPITDAYGTSYLTPLFRKPIAQFDLDNEYSGLATVATAGVQFYLGNNTGLYHYWVDTTAVNGTQYFYAVASYDHGDPVMGVDPSECTKFVAVQATGEIERGTNVVIVRPEAPSAGYVEGKMNESGITPGPTTAATGSVNLKILDQSSIKNNHQYQISFKDSLNASDLKTTASFSLKDLTDNVDLLTDNTMQPGPEGMPVIDGFQLSFSQNPAQLELDTTSSGWLSNPELTEITFKKYAPQPTSKPVELISADFEIIFAEVGVDTSVAYSRSTEIMPARPVNFSIKNTLTGRKVPFAFRERYAETPSDSGIFDWNKKNKRTDEIIFMYNIVDSLVASWTVIFQVTDTSKSYPDVGDMLTLKLNRPFLSNDTYEFSMLAANVDPNLAKTDMDKIKVVPNPYIVTNSWEPKNPYANGRGDRELHFTHLPSKCTIKIFNVRGQLVKEILHEETIDDGTEIWNMLSKDNLEISYGIYIYHIEAEGVGEKIGKFVVIK